MRKLFRTAAVLAAGTMVLTMAGPAQAAPDDASARWLTRQLTDGLIHNDQFGDFEFDDYGLTADTAFALAAIGGQPGAVRDIRTALARHVDSWTTGVDFGSTDVFAGSTAKAVVLAQTTGADPRAFGGVNLVRAAEPTGQRRPRRRWAGSRTRPPARTSRTPSARRSRRRACRWPASGKADEAVRFLLKQQCSPGYFRLGFAAKDRAEPDAATAATAATTSAPDTDVTALAVLSLEAVPRKTAAVRAAIADAVGLAQAQAEGERQPRRRYGDRGEQLQQHRVWPVGPSARPAPAARPSRRRDGCATCRSRVTSPGPRWRGRRAPSPTTGAGSPRPGRGHRSADRDQWRRATAQAAPALGNLTLSACRAG